MDLFDDLDNASAELIIQLQLEDSAILAAVVDTKGKGREGELSDAQLALDMYRNDMQRNNVNIKDRVMARSIAAACMRDSDLITEVREEDNLVRKQGKICNLGQSLFKSTTPSKSVSQNIEQEKPIMTTIEVQPLADKITTAPSPVLSQTTCDHGSMTGDWVADTSQTLLFGNLVGAASECQGTAAIFSRAHFEFEVENETVHQNLFKNICFQESYSKFSPEELRLADYIQGRRYSVMSNQLAAWGTSSSPFQPYVEDEPSFQGICNTFQSICFQQLYSNHSPEELRLADYINGRRYGSSSNQSEARGTEIIPFQAQILHEWFDPVGPLSSFHNICCQESYLNFSTDELRLADYNSGRRYRKQNFQKRKYDSEGAEAESSASGSGRVPPGPCSGLCNSCGDQFGSTDITKVPCGHEYCRECLQRLYTLSMTDDSLFPPRCCKQEMPSSRTNNLLTPLLIEKYEQRKLEFDTADRTYCSNQHCSIFVGPKNITQGRATCSICNTFTCTMCKKESHLGDCPADNSLKQVLDIATENKWRRCYGCREMIELKKGCRHITCRCGIEFCYNCGAKWKTCSCTHWTPDLLATRARQNEDRQAYRPYPPQQQKALVTTTQNTHNSVCDHASWKYVRGSHLCEVCYDVLPSYIYECSECHLNSCERCRHA